MPQPFPLNSIVAVGNCKWRVGAVILTGGERYYFLVDPSDENSTALMPWFVVEEVD